MTSSQTSVDRQNKAVEEAVKLFNAIPEQAGLEGRIAAAVIKYNSIYLQGAVRQALIGAYTEGFKNGANDGPNYLDCAGEYADAVNANLIYGVSNHVSK